MRPVERKTWDASFLTLSDSHLEFNESLGSFIMMASIMASGPDVRHHQVQPLFPEIRFSGGCRQWSQDILSLHAKWAWRTGVMLGVPCTLSNLSSERRIMNRMYVCICFYGRAAHISLLSHMQASLYESGVLLAGPVQTIPCGSLPHPCPAQP